MATEHTETGRKSPWSYFGKMVGINLVIIVALTVLLLTCVSMWLDTYTRHQERVDVPSLQGITVEEAQHYLDNVGLRSMVIDSVYADARPGSVIEQLPAAGIPVKKGRIVYLTINAHGKRMVKMLEVREGGSRQALSTLRSLGFVVDSVRQVASEMDDLVLGVISAGVEMQPDREYPVGTHVVVLVGSTRLQLEVGNEETEEAWME